MINDDIEICYDLVWCQECTFFLCTPRKNEVWPASRRFSERVGEALQAEIWGATDLRIFSRKWWVFICVLEMFWSFVWYLILEMGHHHHHPPKEMVSKLCHGQAPATRLKRHCLCCLSVVSSAGYRPVMFRWASGRSLDNSVCGTWKILEKIRFTSGFLKFGIMGFGIPHPVFSLKPQSHRDRTTMGSGLLNVSHEVCLRKIEIKSFVVIHLRKLFFCVFCVLMWAVPFFKSTCEAKTF